MQENFIGRYVGRYLLEDLINRGGMSAVYRGRHAETGQIVAVKILPGYFAHDPQFLRRFQREARAVAILNHPHIVRVLSTGKADSLPYIVMEYVGGGTLKDLLDQGLLPFERATRLVGQIADALQHAHEHGIVHRDVKPSNVLLVSPDVAKLSDFGIAKMADEGTTIMTALTATGIGVGTAAYMAPEQAIEAASADARADIYSLGVMLFQIVAGRLPYTADTPMGLLAQHIYEPVPSVHRDAPDAPQALERVLLKAMAKDPAARFQSAVDLAQAFADAAANRPVTIDLPPDMEPLDAAPTAVLADTDATYLDLGGVRCGRRAADHRRLQSGGHLRPQFAAQAPAPARLPGGTDGLRSWRPGDGQAPAGYPAARRRPGGRGLAAAQLRGAGLLRPASVRGKRPGRRPGPGRRPTAPRPAQRAAPAGVRRPDAQPHPGGQGRPRSGDGRLLHHEQPGRGRSAGQPRSVPVLRRDQRGTAQHLQELRREHDAPDAAPHMPRSRPCAW